MPKRLFVLALLVLMLATTVNATPIDDLNDLAQYYPEDTIAYGVFRLDDGYRDTLQSVINLVGENFARDEFVPAVFELPPLPIILDQVLLGGLSEFLDLDFNAWTGDSIALGLLSPLEAEAVLITLALSDTDAFLADIADTSPDLAEVEITQVDDVTQVTLTFSGDNLEIVVADDTLFLAENVELALAAATADGAGLLDNAMFNDTMTQMPGDEYNALAYIDGQRLSDEFLRLMAEFDDMGMSAIFEAANMSETNGAIGIGLTALDGRTLALDLATVPTNPDAYTARPGFVLQESVSAGFAANIPGYTQLLIHDYDIQADFQAVIDALDATMPILQSQLEAIIENQDMGFGPEADMLRSLDLSTINLGGVIKHSIIPLFAGFTGLNLEDDVLAWMTEDIALTTSIIPVDGDLGFSFDITLLAATSDIEAKTTVINALGRAAQLYGIPRVFAQDSIAVSFPTVLPQLVSIITGLPDDVTAIEALDFVVAANDDMLAMGSRPGVDLALSGEGDTLADNPVFQSAAGYIVPDAYTVWFVNGQEIAKGIEYLLPLAGDNAYDQFDILSLQFLVAQMESMTISANMDESGATASRLTITLAENVPYMLPEAPIGNVLEEPRPTLAPPMPTATATPGN